MKIIPEMLRKTLNGVVLFFFGSVSLLIVYGIATGFPITLGGWIYRAKNLKVLFLAALVSWILHLILGPEGAQNGVLKFKRRLESAVQDQRSLWILFFVSGLLFTWQQVTEYLALEINFLPFSFYDYMLHYFFQGKVHFTGWLHGYYHHNVVMFLLAPFWKIFQSPLLLVLSYGFLASACIFPLYAIARERFKEPIAPFAIVLTFLSFRYLQNVLRMNFSVEICYPLFILSAVYFAMKRRWPLYYLFLLLALTVKEDSVIYGIAVGMFTFFFRDREQPQGSSHRWHGIVTVALAVCYYAFLRTIYSPLIGSDIMFGNSANFAGYGASFRDMILLFLGKPWLFFVAFLGTKLKFLTLARILSSLVFLPVFSPAIGLMFLSLLPLFLHNTGRDTDFIEMRFHYAAAVLPFIFIAAVFGFSNLLRVIPERWREWTRWILCIALVVVNVGNFRTEKITAENLTSIAWAKQVPPGVLVTHGHLLPYIGYRRQNFYFAVPYMREEHPANKLYSAPDFYLIDLSVNPYPMDRGFFDRKIAELTNDPSYELVRRDRDIRYLFRKKTLVS